MSSTSASHGALIVIGSGPGIGVHTASLFASRGFQLVFLLSRSASRLLEDAKTVKDASDGKATVKTIPVDISDPAALHKALDEIETKLGNVPLEAILHNAARIGQSKFFEWTTDEIERDFRASSTRPYSTNLLIHWGSRSQ